MFIDTLKVDFPTKFSLPKVTYTQIYAYVWGKFE